MSGYDSGQTQGPRDLKASDVTYNSYLHVKELTSLQQPLSNPEHHDEMLFIIIHQAYELWFKLILHELDNCIQFMREKRVLRAHHFLKRVNEILKLLVPQIHILETMTPVEFLQFRDRLMPASGFQSQQFREVEFVAGLRDERFFQYFKGREEESAALRKRFEGPDLKKVYYEMLVQYGFDIPAEAFAPENKPETEDLLARIVQGVLPIYQNPSHHLELYLLSEALVDFDSLLQTWREHHVRVVERVIGFKHGTGGSSGVQYLKSTTHKKCFPALWNVRTALKLEPQVNGNSEKK